MADRQLQAPSVIPLPTESENNPYEFMSDTAFVKADKEGLDVVLPTTRQLFIDIDSQDAHDQYVINRPQFDQWYVVVDAIDKPSKSGGEKRHITLTLLDEITDVERLLLQAFLGSDLKREFLGLMRVKTEDPHPTLFLEKRSTK